MREALFLLDRDCRVAKAAYLATSLGNTRHYARLSYSELMRRLGLTRAQARSVLKRLCARGYVVACPCHLPNGGQVENAYCLTDSGREFLRGGAVRTTKTPMATLKVRG